MRKTKSLLSLLLAVAMACSLVIPVAAAGEPAAANNTGQQSAVLSVEETATTGTFTVTLEPNDSGIACVQFTIDTAGLTVTEAIAENDTSTFAYHGYNSENGVYAAAGRTDALSTDTALLTVTATSADAVAAAISGAKGYDSTGTTPVNVNAASGHTVSGTVTSYISNTEELTVALYSGNTLVKETTTSTYTTANTTGGVTYYTATYELTDVPDGTYTLRVSKAGHVTRDITGVTGTTTVNTKICPKGDVNMSGTVDAIDHQRLYEHLSKLNVISDTYQLAIANVNGDSLNSVDAIDHQRLYEHLSGLNKLF